MNALTNVIKLILPVKQKFPFLALILFFISINSYPQFDSQCLNEDEVPANLPDNTQSPYASKNGLYLPVSGTLRILVVYAEIDYDVGSDPNLEGYPEWPVGQLPVWANDIFDHEDPAGQPAGLLTRYYYEASFGNCVLQIDRQGRNEGTHTDVNGIIHCKT